MKKYFLPALLTLMAMNAEAQNCKKGKRCGNTCIAMNRTCHIASEPPRPASSTPAAPAKRTPLPWIAHRQVRFYYRTGCAPAKTIPESLRVYFKTALEAQRAGYARSKIKGC